MKKLILILTIVISFYSCKKCADCKEVTTTSYAWEPPYSSSVPLPEATTTQSNSSETCGGDLIKYLEQHKTTKLTIPYYNGKNIIATTDQYNVCNEK